MLGPVKRPALVLPWWSVVSKPNTFVSRSKERGIVLRNPCPYFRLLSIAARSDSTIPHHSHSPHNHCISLYLFSRPLSKPHFQLNDYFSWSNDCNEMGRWTQYDEVRGVFHFMYNLGPFLWWLVTQDDYRLPEGMKRVGYDADTQRYTFKDKDGSLWEGPEGQEFGEMRRSAFYGSYHFSRSHWVYNLIVSDAPGDSNDLESSAANKDTLPNREVCILTTDADIFLTCHRTGLHKRLEEIPIARSSRSSLSLWFFSYWFYDCTLLRCSSHNIQRVLNTPDLITSRPGIRAGRSPRNMAPLWKSWRTQMVE